MHGGKNQSQVLNAKQIYEYSVGPWQWIGTLAPRICGDLFPQNTRSTRLLPAEGRTWCPSLYVGLIPIFCFFARVTSKRSCRIWEWIAITGGLFSLGNYGLVWIAQEIVFLSTGHVWLPDVSGALGGPYWWLVTICPGYGVFRYPAKWLIFFCLGVALSASTHLDQLRSKNLSNLIAACWIAVPIAVLGILGTLFFPTELNSETLAHANDSFFGPLNLEGVRAGVTKALMHVLAIAGISIAVITVYFRQPHTRFSLQKVRLLFCTIITVELFICGRPLVVTVPTLPNHRINAKELASARNIRAIRLDSNDRWPPQWRKTSTEQRLRDVEWSQQLSLFVRWHLEHQIAVVNSPVSISSERHRILWQTFLAELKNVPTNDYRQAMAHMARWIGVEKFLNTNVLSTPDGITVSRVYPSNVDAEAEAGSSLQLAVLREWDEIESSDSVVQLKRQLKRVAAAGTARTFIEEAPSIKDLRTVNGGRPQSDVAKVAQGAKIVVQESRAESMRAIVETDAPVLVKYHQFQDGCWKASVRPRVGDQQWRRIDPAHVDYVAQGFILPAGNWEVEFCYDPPWFTPTLIFCLLSWVGIATMIMDLPNRYKLRRVGT